MSSGGRSAEHQAAAEHSLEGQHLMQHLLGQREVLLQELCDKSGTDIKWPPCANPSTPVMDENLTPDAQLSVIEFMLEQRPRPCRRDRQPVELVIVVNAADEGKLAREFRVYSSLTRQTFLALEEQVASLQRKLAESEAAVEVQRSRALASEEQVASNSAVRARRLVISLKHNLRNLGANELVKQLRTELAEAHAENETHAAEVAACWGELDDSLQRNLGANELVKQLRTQLAEAHAEIETHEAEVAACCIFAAAEAKQRQRQYDQKMIDQLRVLLAIAFRQRDRADNEAKLAESEAAVQVQRSHALALASEKLPEEQVTSLQCCKFDGAVELACETSGMVQPPYKAFCVGGVLCGEYCTF